VGRVAGRYAGGEEKGMDTINGKVAVLIVDDKPANLYALKEILKDTHYDIHTANSGMEALKLLLQHEYACCLLDIRMPEMDGFETAELIRHDVQVQHVPIIFVTAEAGDQKDLFKGYEKGAVDFLIKPLEPVIVRSKVKVFGDLYLQKIALKRSQEIEDLNKKLLLLNKDLQIANSELEHFTHIAAHDLREPLRRQRSFIDLLRDELPPDTLLKIDNLMQRIYCSSDQMLEMINDFRTLTKLGQDDFKRSNMNLKEIIEDCLGDFQDKIKSRHVKIYFDLFPPLVSVFASLVKRLYTNLIANAFDHVPQGSFDMHFTVENSGPSWIYGVKNTGSYIPQDQLTQIFKIFRKADLTHKDGTGIGLSICKKIIDRHGGRIKAQSSDEGVHIQFTFEKERGGQ
jgi:two-component system, sensor histidine kinase and response regulator